MYSVVHAAMVAGNWVDGTRWIQKVTGSATFLAILLVPSTSILLALQACRLMSHGILAIIKPMQNLSGICGNCVIRGTAVERKWYR